MQVESQDTLERNRQPILPLTTFQSDDLTEKLKVLNYEKDLLRDMKMKPLARFYFIRCTNPGEQFFMFTSICWWLMRKLGKQLDKPQEYDDPNETIAKLVRLLEEIDIRVDFSPNKLIQGAGPICLHVLDCLATQALKVAKINFQPPHVKQDDDTATDYMEDNAEIILEKLDDEQEALSDDSDMELGGNSLKDLNWIKKPALNDRQFQARSSNNEYDATDNINEQECWRLEVERILPQLRVLVKADSRDWRTHLNQMDSLKQNIETISEETQLQLKKLYSEFTFSLEKMESREKHLNNELQTMIKQFKEISIELTSVQFATSQVQKDTEQLLNQLSEVIHENDVKKAEMEQRGQTMTDGSSVVQIKKAIVKLKDDVSHLNLEIALFVHSIDQDILRQTSSYSGHDSMLLGAVNVK